MTNNDEWKLIPVVAILVALDTEKKESAELSYYIFLAFFLLNYLNILYII